MCNNQKWSFQEDISNCQLVVYNEDKLNWDKRMFRIDCEIHMVLICYKYTLLTLLKEIQYIWLNALLKSCTSVHVPSLMNETDHGIVKKRIIIS